MRAWSSPEKETYPWRSAEPCTPSTPPCPHIEAAECTSPFLYSLSALFSSKRTRATIVGVEYRQLLISVRGGQGLGLGVPLSGGANTFCSLSAR